MNKTKILYISNSSPNRLDIGQSLIFALKKLPSIVFDIEYQWVDYIKVNFFSKFFNKIRLPLDFDNLNKRILKKNKLFLPDIIFICKCNCIYPSTLKKIKRNNSNVKIILYSQDDYFNKSQHSIYIYKSLRIYDLVVTLKSFNLKELKKFGVKKALFQNCAFCIQKHMRPFAKNPINYDYDVLFVGYAEKYRFDVMNYLASNGIVIHIYGKGWDRPQYLKYHSNIKIKNQELLGKEYSSALYNSKINLGFLRKSNRDLQSNRIMEIPACGGFMITENNSETTNLFKEGIEAEFFSSKEELLQKIKYYLKHDNKRCSIANAGYEKVNREKHNYDYRISEILSIVNES